MSFGGAIRAVLAAALLAGAAPAVADAAGFPDIDAAVQSWRTAKEELRRDTARYDDLARRIAVLKRRDPASPDLERLLQQSVAATAKLEALARTQEGRAREVEARTTAAIRSIDAEILRQKPGLHMGTLADRKEVARILSTLNGRRKELEGVLAELRPPKPATPKEWARYEVKVDPLDGPRELRGKADFLEDTRDKFLRKRAALTQLIQDKRQERELNRMQQDFRRDLSHFDEELRTGRVTREAAGGATTLSAGGSNNESTRSASPSPSPPTAVAVGEADDANQNPSAAGPNGARGGAASPPPAAPSNDGFSQSPGGGGAETPASPQEPAAKGPAAAPTIPTAPGATAQLPKNLDPNLLLNLRVEDLGGARDVKELEALVADLEKLDQFLLSQAEEIRRHAKRLEADEAPGKAP